MRWSSVLSPALLIHVRETSSISSLDGISYDVEVHAIKEHDSLGTGSLVAGLG